MVYNEYEVDRAITPMAASEVVKTVLNLIFSLSIKWSIVT